MKGKFLTFFYDLQLSEEVFVKHCHYRKYDLRPLSLTVTHY